MSTPQFRTQQEFEAYFADSSNRIEKQHARKSLRLALIGFPVFIALLVIGSFAISDDEKSQAERF